MILSIVSVTYLDYGNGRGSFDSWFSPSDVTALGDDDDDEMM